MRLLTIRSFFYSILIHLVVAGLLVISFSSTPRPVIKPVAAENIIEATTIDNQEVEKELKRLQEEEKKKQQQEQRKQQELEKKLKDLERQQREAVNKRKQEERRITELKKKQEAEEKQLREKEKQRLEEEKKRREVEEQRRKEAEEEKTKREEEQRKKEAEEALKKQLAEEQAAEQERRDQSLLQKIIADIYRQVTGNFNKTGLPKGLECVLSVRTIPGGEVISVEVNKSSGNEIFDRRAITAVEKASPLPLPVDPATFERLKLRRFNFRFKPED